MKRMTYFDKTLGRDVVIHSAQPQTVTKDEFTVRLPGAKHTDQMPALIVYAGGACAIFSLS